MNGVCQAVDKLRTLHRLACGRFSAFILALLGASVGRKVFVGSRCIINRPWKIRLGDRVVLESDVYLKMVSDSSALELAPYVFLGRGVQFDLSDKVTVGSHTLISPGCFITDHNHDTSPDSRVDQQGCVSRKVVIGADVWIGTGTVILPGVTIGNGAVIGAGTVVTRNVESMTVVGGNPARFIRQRATLAK